MAVVVVEVVAAAVVAVAVDAARAAVAAVAVTSTPSARWNSDRIAPQGAFAVRVTKNDARCAL